MLSDLPCQEDPKCSLIGHCHGSNLKFLTLYNAHGVVRSKNKGLQRESNARSHQWNALLTRRVLARSAVHRIREAGREGFSQWNEAPEPHPFGAGFPWLSYRPALCSLTPFASTGRQPSLPLKLLRISTA